MCYFRMSLKLGLILWLVSIQRIQARPSVCSKGGSKWIHSLGGLLNLFFRLMGNNRGQQVSCKVSLMTCFLLYGQALNKAGNLNGRKSVCLVVLAEGIAALRIRMLESA